MIDDTSDNSSRNPSRSHSHETPHATPHPADDAGRGAADQAATHPLFAQQSQQPWETQETEIITEEFDGEGRVVRRTTTRTRPLSGSLSRPLSTPHAAPLDDQDAFAPRTPPASSSFLNHTGATGPVDPMDFGASPGNGADETHGDDGFSDLEGSYWQSPFQPVAPIVTPSPAPVYLRDAETLQGAAAALRGRSPQDIARTIALRARRHPAYLASALCLLLVFCTGLSALLMLSGAIATPPALVLATPTNCPLCPATSTQADATAPSGTTATAGNGGSGCCAGKPTNTPSGKRQSTPTPLPTTPPGAPTATPIPYASSATVSFTAVSQTLAGAGGMTSCVSGCTPSAKTTNGSTSGSATIGTTGWTQTSLGGTVAVRLNPDSAAGWSDSGSFSVCAGGNCCGVSGTWFSGTVNYFTCTWYPGWTSYVAAGGWSGNGNAGQTCSGVNIDGPCSFSWWNSGAFTSSGHATVTDADCHNALNAAESRAQSTANSNISSALSGWTIVGKSISADQNAWTCSPAIGQAGTSVTGGARATYSAIGYHPSDAQSIASQRINALLPSDDYWSSGPSTCTPSASANGTSSINVTCSDSGTATYDWRGSSLGQSHSAALLSQFTGQTVTSAKAACNNTPGVVAGSCVITTSGGSAWMPTSTSAITLSVSVS